MARHGHFWSPANLPLPSLYLKNVTWKDLVLKCITRNACGLMVLVVEVVVEISYLEICSTSPNSKKNVLFKQRGPKWLGTTISNLTFMETKSKSRSKQLTQDQGGSKGLGGSAGKEGIGLAAQLEKQGSARLEEFRLTNTAQARLEAVVPAWVSFGITTYLGLCGPTGRQSSMDIDMIRVIRRGPRIPIVLVLPPGEGKGRGKLASDREGFVACHMGTQFCFRVYVSVF
ncbi:hypothetical protein E6C27_scaffold538G00420 [Cucumis melo var. makuwa]|uniref:Uncharacterized protein n=1 Tax=Cucumis melo var. makuwa TaxID=1194695 RepID=A0A5A7VC30_CUCMM|nr:hypothetical protein E6C27_scaffold538G00420 [Cucumis melo var. makuwa]